MHPASGVQAHEEQYPEMARAMGIDPATKKYVPFDISDKKFAENYMKVLHHPLEKQGVDFFWLDWQQEHSTKVEGLNPTWWLNYVHTSDMERRGLRPLIYHRWGGLGNHRYQVGFSGDTVSEWVSLAFQPFFTATAANVGYGYWSHDIGGHLPGPVQPELYTRWVQYGLFSPILRTHTTKDPKAERRIWAYPQEYASVMRDAFLLRYALIPYLYTASRVAYDTGLSMCRPLYYDYPEVPEAYSATDEYLFGESMIVAPITSPVSPDSNMATRKVWLPEGEWVEWFTGARFTGPISMERSFTLAEIPVYVRAGAIVPMQPKMQRSDERPVDPLILTVFPGKGGSTRIYEDAGDGLGYKTGAFRWTPVRHEEQADGTRKIEVLPGEGRFDGMLEARGYEVRLPSALPPQRITFKGQAVPFLREGCTGQAPCWSYDGRTLTTSIRLPRTSAQDAVTLLVTPRAMTAAQAKLVDGYAARLTRLENAMEALNNTWPKGWSPDVLVDAIQTASRIDVNPMRALEELEKLAGMLPQIEKEIKAQDVDEKAKAAALKRLGI
jgi:alpha-glucosidase